MDKLHATGSRRTPVQDDHRSSRGPSVCAVSQRMACPPQPGIFIPSLDWTLLRHVKFGHVTTRLIVIGQHGSLQ